LRFSRDKDLAWIITFTSFLIFLLSAIACSILQKQPERIPEPVILASASFGKSFAGKLFSLIRYLSLASIGLGIIGVITWPPGQGST